MEAHRIQWRKKNADGCSPETTDSVNSISAVHNVVGAAGDRLEREKADAGKDVGGVENGDGDMEVNRELALEVEDVAYYYYE